jgi:hypothetical protein
MEGVWDLRSFTNSIDKNAGPSRNMADLQDALDQIQRIHHMAMEVHGTLVEFLMNLPESYMMEEGVHQLINQVVLEGQSSIVTLESLEDSHDVQSLLEGMNTLVNYEKDLGNKLTEAMHAPHQSEELRQERIQNLEHISEDLEDEWNRFLIMAQQEVNSQMGGRLRKRKSLRKRTHRKRTHRGKTHRKRNIKRTHRNRK